MCFKINKRAQRPKIRVAYKAVTLHRNKIYSRIFSTAYPWKTGVRRAGGNAPYIRHVGKAAYAGRGIYVYRTLKQAQDQCRWRPNAVVLKVEVDPEDWICTDESGDIFTYRKVTVPEDQPDIDWY